MEPKRLYRAVKEDLPDDDATIPIGQARLRREGDDVVLISYGASMAETLKAADALDAQGVSADVIDLRSLLPWDQDLVLERVARVGRVVVISEAPRTLSSARRRARCRSPARSPPRSPRRRSTCSRRRPCASPASTSPTRTPRTAPTCPVPIASCAPCSACSTTDPGPRPAGGPVPQDVKLPELAESVVEGEVLKWLVAVGDAVVVDQPIVEVMTDKVTVELPSPLAGVLAEIVAPEGAVVPVGAVLARVHVGGGVAGAVAGAEPPGGANAPAPAPATPTAEPGGRAATVTPPAVGGGAAPPRATPTAGGRERAASPLDGEGDDADAADGVAQGDEFSLFKASADDDTALPTVRRRAVGASSPSRPRAVLQESSACRSSKCSAPAPPGGCGSTTSAARRRTSRRPPAACRRRCAP